MIHPDDPLPPCPLSEREILAAATTVIQQKGDQAEVYVAERIGNRAIADDGQGVAVWKAVARQIQQIKDAPEV